MECGIGSAQAVKASSHNRDRLQQQRQLRPRETTRQNYKLAYFTSLTVQRELIGMQNYRHVYH